MNTIKCRHVKDIALFKHGYVAEIELIEGSIPQQIGLADHIQYNNNNLQLPLHLVETKKEGIYYLFLDTSNYREQKNSIIEQFQYTSFTLGISEYSSFSIQSNYKKMLLIIDSSALFESLPIIDFLALNQINTDVYLITERNQGKDIDYLQHKLGNNIILVPSFDGLQSIFDGQAIGTYLFISGSWLMINTVTKIAYNAGFTDDEIQYKGVGPKKEKIMCVKCYSLNENQMDDEVDEITCKHCNAVLEVSNHYSKRHVAYLGYIKDKEYV